MTGTGQPPNALASAIAASPHASSSLSDPVALEDRLRAARARRAAAIASRQLGVRQPCSTALGRPAAAPPPEPPAPDLPAGLHADELRAALARSAARPASAPPAPREATRAARRTSTPARLASGLFDPRPGLPSPRALTMLSVAAAGLIFGMAAASLWGGRPPGRPPVAAVGPAAATLAKAGGVGADFLPAAGRLGPTAPTPDPVRDAAADDPAPEPAAAAEPIGPPPPSRPQTVVLRSAPGADPATRDAAAAALRTAGFGRIGVLPPPAPFERASIRYYSPADAGAAAAAAAALGDDLPAAGIRDYTGAPSRMGPGRIEVWIAPAPGVADLPDPPDAEQPAPVVEADLIRSLVDIVASERAAAQPAGTAEP